MNEHIIAYYQHKADYALYTREIEDAVWMLFKEIDMQDIELGAGGV